MRISIFWQLFIWFLINALIPIFLISTIGYQISKKHIENQFINELAITNKAKKEELGALLLHKQYYLQFMAHCFSMDNRIKDLTESYKENHTGEKYLQKINILRKQLAFDQSKGGFHDIHIITLQGDIIFTMLAQDEHKSNLNTGPYKNSKLAEAFNNCITLLSPDITSFEYYPPAKTQTSFIGVPIFYKEQLFAILIGEINSNQLFHILSDYPVFSKSQDIVLWSKSGNKITTINQTKTYPPNTTVVIGSKEAYAGQKSVLGNTGFGYYKDMRKKEVLSYWSYLPWIEGGLVIKIDKDEIFYPIYIQEIWTAIPA